MEEYINDLFPENFDSLSDDEIIRKNKETLWRLLVLSAGGGSESSGH